MSIWHIGKKYFSQKYSRGFTPQLPNWRKEPSPPCIVDALAKKTFVKRKVSQNDTAAGDAGQTQSAANPHRRMYTVLPPPADYKTHSKKSITLPQLESINSPEDPAVESVHESNEELDQDKEQEEHKRKRRRRKRKLTLQQDSGQDGSGPGSEHSTGQSQTAVDEGGERISRNKKRKLKKKRHKERLLSMGVMPRAAALEFTYQKDGEEEEEEDNERRAAEVSDFLRTTLEIYMSDSSLRADKLPLLSGTVDDLLSHISSRCQPNPVLKQLHSLKAFVQQKATDKLEKALRELDNNSPMSAEGTAAVVSLFQYWITDILPMQGDKKTGLSATHP
ncbi:glutamate-rich protein 1 [Lates calcarifer]|uniref:Glutamate-rich protein 1 n=1 Tax=Lates calcarifer TaxID=8187 RepID=A0AAJ7QDR2_LATCA|nr:glutamate-rich protein 1 [Lates calcarifer]